jgi:glutamyl-tRNA reductase
MHLIMLGINHRTAPVELREKLSISGEGLDRFYQAFKDKLPHTELVMLSTCNRTELYAAAIGQCPTREDLVQLLADHCKLDAEKLLEVSYLNADELAIAHLCRVATGLDSMVLGEQQIIGQVKRAYQIAKNKQTTGSILHRVFQSSLAAAKQTRTATGIDAGRVSVGSVAVDFVRQVFSRFDDKLIVCIGAGEMVKVTLRHLKDLNPRKLLLTNRTQERAQDLAKLLELKQPQTEVRPFEQLDDLLVEADIVLTGTGSAQPILTSQRFKPLLGKRRSRPLCIIDIAVPRDAEASLDSLSNIYLYNIDHLQQVVESTQTDRESQVRRCEQILIPHAQTCMLQIKHNDVGRLIKNLRHCLHDLGKAEEERTVQKMASSSPEEIADLIAEHNHRLINKILHLPMQKLNHKTTDDNGLPIDYYAAALQQLFQLEDDTTDEAASANVTSEPDTEAQAPQSQPEELTDTESNSQQKTSAVAPDPAPTPAAQSQIDPQPGPANA